jgi:hypothetical protein
MKVLLVALMVLGSVSASAEEGLFDGFKRAGKVLGKDLKKVAKKSNETLCEDGKSKCAARIENEADSAGKKTQKKLK